VDDTKIFLAHGSPNDPDEYVYPKTLDRDSSQWRVLIFCLGQLRIYNSRKEFKERNNSKSRVSWGSPADQDPASAYAILDTDSKRVELKRTWWWFYRKSDRNMRTTYLPEQIAFRLRAWYLGRNVLFWSPLWACITHAQHSCSLQCVWLLIFRPLVQKHCGANIDAFAIPITLISSISIVTAPSYFLNCHDFLLQSD